MIDLINGKVEFNGITFDSQMTFSKFCELFKDNDSVTQIDDGDFEIVNTNLTIGTLQNECVYLRFYNEELITIVMKFKSINNEHENISKFIDMFKPVKEHLAIDRMLFNRGKNMHDREWCMPYGKILQRSYTDQNYVAISFCYNDWLFEFTFDGEYEDFYNCVLRSGIFWIIGFPDGIFTGSFYGHRVQILYDDVNKYFSVIFCDGSYEDLLHFKKLFADLVPVNILNNFANINSNTDSENELPF